MNMYIFVNVARVSSRYHPEGGLVAIAADIEQVKQLAEVTGGEVELSDDDIQNAIVYPLKGKHEAKMFIFPDAGCC